MTLNQARTEQMLFEKDEALVLIAQRKHLLDYKVLEQPQRQKRTT